MHFRQFVESVYGVNNKDEKDLRAASQALLAGDSLRILRRLSYRRKRTLIAL